MRPMRMRGTDQQQNHVFSYISPEQRVRKDHPLRPIRAMVDEILKQLSPQFNKMYAKVGRPSIPPEQLLRAQLLQMLYSVRSERLLMEEMDYNILFRWFVGLNLDDPVWDATVFTKNRDRLLEAEVAKEFLARVVGQAREKGWTSDEHFTVDGTLLEAWASVKSFQPKDQKNAPPPDDPGNPTVNFRRRAALEPDARIEKRSRRAFGAQRRGQGGQVELQRKSAGGESQRIDCVQHGCGKPRAPPSAMQRWPCCRRFREPGGVTVGGDKGFDTAEFVRECRNMRVTPHVAQNLGRRGGSAIDGRTTRHAGLSHQPEEKEAHRRMFWLAEDDCVAAQGAASRNVEGGLDVYLRLCGLQSGAHAKPDGRRGSSAVSPGRSVSARR